MDLHGFLSISFPQPIPPNAGGQDTHERQPDLFSGIRSRELARVGVIDRNIQEVSSQFGDSIRMSPSTPERLHPWAGSSHHGLLVLDDAWRLEELGIANAPPADYPLAEPPVRPAAVRPGRRACGPAVDRGRPAFLPTTAPARPRIAGKVLPVISWRKPGGFASDARLWGYQQPRASARTPQASLRHLGGGMINQSAERIGSTTGQISDVAGIGTESASTRRGGRSATPELGRPPQAAGLFQPL
jgi:hypothetical protein